ncbi:MAG: dockerin type I repeat-containing protein [Ruminococcus flavefaciens]|nr:dockerin type I repeat-containing protein [Ruminococcus flavefaciens]MCM1361858.1 dockerin type I repeat-containing protein [Clostridiales bacterium]
MILQKYLTKKYNLTDEQFFAADLNNDGTVNVFDVIILKRRILKG